jgi:hypothetical protein
MAYDAVFRKRLIEYKNAGHTFKDEQEAFSVDSKRYYSWKKQLEQTGSLEYKSPKERRGNIIPSSFRRFPFSLCFMLRFVFTALPHKVAR